MFLPGSVFVIVAANFTVKTNKQNTKKQVHETPFCNLLKNIWDTFLLWSFFFVKIFGMWNRDLEKPTIQMYYGLYMMPVITISVACWIVVFLDCV